MRQPQCDCQLYVRLTGRVAGVLMKCYAGNVVLCRSPNLGGRSSLHGSPTIPVNGINGSEKECCELPAEQKVLPQRHKTETALSPFCSLLLRNRPHSRRPTPHMSASISLLCPMLQSLLGWQLSSAIFYWFQHQF